MKKPAAPNRYAGRYCDRTGGQFLVPAKPDFALHRLDAAGQPGTLLHQNETEFTAALGFGTFTPTPQ